MTDRFPKLTEVNVRYWYWECDPAWSGHDIAKELGCCIQTVYNFMRKKKIRIRNYSEAEINANKCPHKYKSKHGMKFEECSEWKENQRKAQLKIWEDNPKKRDEKSAIMKKAYSNKLINYQEWILFIFYKKNDKKTLEDIVKITKLNNKIINRVLYKLTNKKMLKYCTNKVNSYTITELGKKTLSKEFKNKKYNLNIIRSELKKIRKLNLKRNDLAIETRIQNELLQEIN